MRFRVEDWPPGELTRARSGDVVEFRPTIALMGSHWTAIGVAVMNGAELRIIKWERN